MDIRIHFPVWEQTQREDLKLASSLAQRGWHISLNSQDVSKVRAGHIPHHSLDFFLFEPNKQIIRHVVKGTTTKYMQWLLCDVEETGKFTNKKYFNTLEEVLQHLDE